MDISKSVVLVTGANRGLGAKIAQEFVSRGAQVYAGARNPSEVTLPGVTPLAVNTTNQTSIDAAVQAAGDVTVLINNAGISRGVDLLTGDLSGARAELDTNYFGTLEMIRAFAPVIERNGGGAILNVLSVLSWLSIPDSAGYCVSKSAEWSMTNAVRQQLLGRGIRVSGLHVGLMDTDMAADITGPKTDPATVARLAVDGVASGAFEIIADDVSKHVLSVLSGGAPAIYPGLQA
jgi:NAD(P)-dependent dehydrogenase (short-subunit alcohol dehydrogenase family)